MSLGPFAPIPPREKIRRSHINDLRTALTGIQDAYDVAVANGFTGTRGQWLDSLKGPPGAGLAPIGSAETVDDLPSDGNTVGDVRTADDTGRAYRWSGSAWVDIGLFRGPPGDLSKSVADTLYPDKAATEAALNTLTPAADRIITGTATGITERRVPTIDAGAAPYNIVAEAVPTLDFATELQAAIDAGAALGGADILLPGKVGIASDVFLRSGVRLVSYTMRQYQTLTADQTGAWLVWTGANDGTGTMLHVGTSDQTEPVRGAGLDGVGLDGQSRNVTCLSITSNTTTSPLYVTKELSFRNVLLAKAARGIRWGHGAAETQADSVIFEQGGIYNMSEYGMYIDGTNCADYSTFRNWTWSNCSEPGDPYVHLQRSGFLTFEMNAAGGDGQAEKDWLFTTSTTGKTLLYRCQTEKMRYAVHQSGFNINDPLIMIGCIWDDDILIEASTEIHSYDSKVKGVIYLDGAGSRWYGRGDLMQESEGANVIKHPSAIYRNEQAPHASANSRYYVGDVLAKMPSETLPTTIADVCVRTGRRHLTAWAPETAYSTAVERSWVPSTAYTVGAFVTPTWGNGRRYRCTVAGTSGSVEPRWKVYGTVAIADGTASWVLDGSTTSVNATIYRQASPDNGHIYKVVTAGTSGSTQPSWPTTTGATVVDGTVTWQETGASAKFGTIAVS